MSLMLALLAGIVTVPRRARWRHLGLWRSMARDSLITIVAVLAAACLFDMTWGVYYARVELARRLGWSQRTATAAPAEELAALASALVDATNADYAALGGSPDRGTPTPSGDLQQLHDRLEGGFGLVARAVPFAPGAASRRGPPKPIGVSVVLSYLGLSGFYFPWTAEASFNHMTPASALPHVIAHEKAHQRGAASEDEAQFIGFLACIESGDPWARYSGRLFAQRELLFQLLAVDRGRAIALVSRRHPGVQRDVDAETAFWAGYRGPAREVSRAVNDAYLRAQGVEGGIDSYRGGARLLVLQSRGSDRR